MDDQDPEGDLSARPTPPPLADDSLNRPVWIEGGTFSMGSTDGFDTERPVHRVTVSGFWIQEHEVTNEEYRRFDAGHQFPSGQERHPVVRVNWQEAMDYAASRGGGSLPTEAQWEFAARGAAGRTYPWGDAVPACRLAQYAGCDPRATLPVMSRPDGATPDSIYDLTGNVWEWVADWFGLYSSADATDPTGPESGANQRGLGGDPIESSRVLRGGSFDFGAFALSGSTRYGGNPDDGSGDVGFRVVWARVVETAR